MKTILISQCFLGVCCRYDGTGGKLDELEQLKERYHLIPICPEILGGLSTPRNPAERQGQKVVTRDGCDVTAQYNKGARESLKLARLFGASGALLKERSPSCGSGEIYDGTFSKQKTAGYGVAAQLLKEHGIPVFGESQVKELIAYLDEEAL